MLFLVIEHFKDGDPAPVYRRFRDRGRLLPVGVEYEASWVASDLRSCWQVMRAERRELLEPWLASWRDLVDFEVHEVLGSADALARIAPRL